MNKLRIICKIIAITAQKFVFYCTTKPNKVRSGVVYLQTELDTLKFINFFLLLTALFDESRGLDDI